VGIGLSFFGQLTGVNIVIYYGPIVLEQAGVKLGGALSYQVISASSTYFHPASAVEDRSLGRRPCWSAAWVSSLYGLSIIALQFSLEVESALLIGVVSVRLYGVRGRSICAVIWVITGENLFPTACAAAPCRSPRS
jgi:SP family arabinose:H+ symporter-like MFS transporter